MIARKSAEDTSPARTVILLAWLRGCLLTGEEQAKPRLTKIK